MANLMAFIFRSTVHRPNLEKEHLLFIRQLWGMLLLACLIATPWFAYQQSWLVVGHLLGGGALCLLLYGLSGMGKDLSLLLLLFSAGFFLTIFSLVAVSGNAFGSSVAIATPGLWVLIPLVEGHIRGRKAAFWWLVGIVVAMLFLYSGGLWPKSTASVSPYSEILALTIFTGIVTWLNTQLSSRYGSLLSAYQQETAQHEQQQGHSRRLIKELKQLQKLSDRQAAELSELKLQSKEVSKQGRSAQKSLLEFEAEATHQKMLTQALGANTGLAYATLDLGLNIMEHNSGFEELVALKNTGKKVLSYRELLTEASQVNLDKVPEALQSGEKKLIEQQHALKRGGKIITATFNRLESGKGEFNAILMSVSDATKAEGFRKQAILWENESKAAIAHMHALAIAWNPEGDILWLNPFAERTLGLTSDEVKGKAISGNIFPAKMNKGYTVQKMLEELRIFPENFKGREIRTLNSQKEVLPIVWNIQPIKGDGDELMYYLALGTEL